MKVTKLGYQNYLIVDTILGAYCSTEYYYWSKKEAVSLFKDKYKELYLLQREAEEDVLDDSPT